MTLKNTAIIFLGLLISRSVSADVPPQALMSEAWPLLSTPVKIWSGWLGLITITSVFFIRQRPHGKWIALLLLSMFVTAFLITSLSNPDRLSIGLLSTLHILFWTPVVILLTRSIGDLKLKSPYGFWSLLLMLSLWISLIFDFQAAARWLFG